MRLQKQTEFGSAVATPGQRGNCFSACVASILGVDLKHVPNFMNHAPSRFWYEDAVDWLDERGLALICYGGETSPISYMDKQERACMIASGTSPRGDFMHSVLWKGGKLFFDPHPSNDGIVGPVKDWCILVVSDMDKFLEYKSDSRHSPP